MRSKRGVLVVAALAAVATVVAVQGAGAMRDAKPSSPATGCQLNSPRGNIKHVVFLIFDNVHFLRDNPNVPSDLEQMPNLLNFIRSNGTLLTNDHTVLISHTANGILTNLTGMYSDRHGQPVANSYRYFKSDGSTASSSSFKYWTDLTDDVNSPPTDPNFNMVNADSGTPRNAPAPWVPYTEAGCDWGATALANVVLENTGTGPAGDMTKVFGSGSPEWNEAATSNAAPAGTAARNLAQTDFVGLAVHCASTTTSICHDNPNARPDQLPDEAGYAGFQGLFGAKYVNPAICTVSTSNCTNATVNGQTALKKLDGTQITDQFGQPGFPGFDGLFASTTLSYVAQMQEAGIPVTFGYISDAHDQHGVAGEIHATRGPGEADYVQQLHNYDVAFGQFFDRLAADGINKSNTLFAFTVEEGDHFAGAQPTNPSCDGVTTPCTYSLVGEINGNLAGLLATQQGITTPFTVHADMAPTIYLTGNPSRTAPVTRAFGRAVGALTAVNPYTGQTDHITAALADPVEMKTLHMVTADPQRTPTLTMFAQPDYFLFAGAPNCTTPCITVPTTPPTNTFAWNHGGIQPEIATTWAGLVGPGVRNNGDDSTWVDHTDIRPTMLDLVGLGDSYVHDGRVLIDQLDAWAVPQTLIAHRETLRRLGEVYKQLNAPFGSFGMDTLKASTKAVESGSATDDSTYTTIADRIASLTTSRDALASQIRAALDGAAFGSTPIDEQQAKSWISAANDLLAQAAALAAS
ncbi:MAG TPA: hypothetical protein VFI01_03380 [Gaiellaceae bacterium]|nr:hypothetical protein [Gaiellaceae bacterium]